MELNFLWFILISVLFCGYFFLEGFDYGVGVLLPFIGKNEQERKMIVGTIAPFWDGNEVWLITAGGAIFAAFPVWYATMFSGFYLPLFLVLLALILRGVGVEFRIKVQNKKWTKACDAAFFIGSLVPALLWGVAFSNLLKGVPIDSNLDYIGGFFDLISLYTLLAGLMGFIFFVYHGAVFITLRTEHDLAYRSKKIAQNLGIISLILGILLVVYTAYQTNLFARTFAMILIGVAALTLIVALYFVKIDEMGKAIIFNGLTVIFVVASFFTGLYPNVMVSSLDTRNNLTIFNASSSPYTLKIMTIIALTLVPIVLIYQSWTYWVFRKKVTKGELEY